MPITFSLLLISKLKHSQIVQHSASETSHSLIALFATWMEEGYSVKA